MDLPKVRPALIYNCHNHRLIITIISELCKLGAIER